jgi:hypothetical protein
MSIINICERWGNREIVTNYTCGSKKLGEFVKIWEKLFRIIHLYINVCMDFL